MLIKGDLSKLSCIVYVKWRLFSPCRRQGFYSCHPIFHFSALLLLCLLQCVKGNYYLNVGLVNLFLCQKKTGCNNPLLII